MTLLSVHLYSYHNLPETHHEPGSLLTPGAGLNRVLAGTLCLLLGADSGLCVALARSVSSRAVAADVQVAQREFFEEEALPGRDPVVPPYPQDAGPDVIRPDFGDGLPQQGVFRRSDTRQIDAETFEFVMESSEGCQLTARFKTQNDASFYESMKFIPSSPEACGVNSYEYTFQDQGRTIFINVSSGDLIKLEQISETQGRITYTNSSGQTNSSNFLIDYGQSHKNPEKPIQTAVVLQDGKDDVISEKGIVDRYTNFDGTLDRKIACGTLKGLCDILPLAQAATAVVGAVATGATAGVAAAPSAGLLLLETAGAAGCSAVFGGIPPLPFGQLLRSSAALGGAGGIIGRLGSEYTKAFKIHDGLLSAHVGAFNLGGDIAGTDFGISPALPNFCKRPDSRPPQSTQPPQTQPQQTQRNPENLNCLGKWAPPPGENPGYYSQPVSCTNGLSLYRLINADERFQYSCLAWDRNVPEFVNVPVTESVDESDWDWVSQCPVSEGGTFPDAAVYYIGENCYGWMCSRKSDWNLINAQPGDNEQDSSAPAINNITCDGSSSCQVRIKGRRIPQYTLSITYTDKDKDVELIEISGFGTGEGRRSPFFQTPTSMDSGSDTHTHYVQPWGRCDFEECRTATYQLQVVVVDKEGNRSSPFTIDVTILGSDNSELPPTY